MARHPRSVDNAIARFDELAHRLDGHTVASVRATGRHYGRQLRSVGRRIRNIAFALLALMLGTIALGLTLNGIGLTGLFAVAVATIFILIFFSVWPSGEPKRAAFSDKLPTRAVVQGLDSYLVSQRRALPTPAARRVDAITAQLPMLEHKLADLNPLDPLAQDARRLMGQHLPDLIDRYERVPAQYRSERDGEGLTVDERLVAGLDAAKAALDDIGTKLVQSDRDALETQGRFIESRYRDGVGGNQS